MDMMQTVDASGKRMPKLSLGTWKLRGAMAGDIAVPVLAVGCAATLIVAGLHISIRPRMIGLGAFGRMALTNCVSQSLVYVVADYGFGLNLFTKVGTAADVGLAFVVTAVQIVFSRWWLRHHRFDGSERISRSIAYGRLQPLKRG